MLTKEQVAKLLNRSLTPSELANFDLYIKIVVERLEDLLCLSLCGDCGDGTRTYQPREGYRTLFIDPFTSIISVSINDVEQDVSKYTVKQNDMYNGGWYNSIEFHYPMNGRYNIVVDADWGFGNIPLDLQLLIARLFAQGSVEQRSDNQVKSKKIEDFTVTFKDGSTFGEFATANQSIISKYSLCNVGRISHGRIHTICDDGLYFPRT
jgi:hypothetical protein